MTPRRVLILTALLLAPASALVAPATAAGDTAPPVITGWSFNADSFEMGDELVLTFNVSDESRIRTTYFALVHEASGGSFHTFGFGDLDVPSGEYQGNFTWDYGARGNYTLAYYYVEDTLGNWRYVYPSEFPAGAPTRVFLGPSMTDVRVNVLFGPYFATEGENVTYDAAIENLGDATVGPFNVTFYVDATPQASYRVDSLGSGAHTWLAMSWTATAGEHVVAVAADAWNEVAEADEGNNKESRNLSVSGSGPDLVLDAIWTSPSTPTDGELTLVTTIVRNQGTEPAGNFTVAFYADGSWFGARNVGSLAPGASTNVSAWWHAQAGWHTLDAYADAHGNVSETSEWNNGISTGVWVDSTAADLVVDSLSTPYNATEEDFVWLSALVRNDGGSAGDFHVKGYVDGVPLVEQHVWGLAAGGYAWVNFPWYAQRGEHSFSVVVDPYDYVRESNEDNNDATTWFYVAPLPGGDASVRILSSERTMLRTDFTPPVTNPLGERAVRVAVSNAGPAETGDVVVALWAQPVGESAVFVGILDEPSLAPSETRELTFTWDPRGFAGDVDLVARISTARLDADLRDNEDTYRDFVLVGGLGRGTFQP